jgi:mono/diheme cytochrome c family protein
MRRFAGAAAGVIGLVICVWGCRDPAAEEAPRVASGPADPTDARAVAEGEAVYLAHCASCHGTRLQGQPKWQEPLPDGGYPAPPHDGSGHTWRHSDQQLFEATKFGGRFSAAPGSVSHMPPFENVLSEDEVWDALAFVKSRWPAELQARQRLLTRMRAQRPHAGHEGHTGVAGDPAE